MSKKIDKFNYYYVFISRILKIFLVLLVIVAVIWKISYIDWSGTADKLIAEYIPLKMSATAPPTSTSSDVVVLAPNIDYVSIYQNGKIIFTVDKPYDTSKKKFTIDKMVIKGKPNYKQPFLYAGAKIRIVHISEKIGILITGQGVEGPVLRGVDCVVE